MKIRNAILLLSLVAVGCEAPAVASKADPALVAKLAVAAGLAVNESAAPAVPAQKVGDPCFYCNGVGKVSDGVVAPKMCIPCKGTGKVQPPDASDTDQEETTESDGPKDQPVLTQDDLTGPTEEGECEDGDCASSQEYVRPYRRRLFRRW